MRIGLRLGVTLLVLAAGAAVLHTVPPVKGAVNPSVVFALPATLGAWSGTDGISEGILPLDPSEQSSVRRTYRNGTQVAWISVSQFAGQNDEARRASINKIYPIFNVSLIEKLSLTVSLTGSPASPATLPAVVIHQDFGRLLVTYWHQIENDVYGGEYRYRLALMRDLILKRRADTLLVRIATSATPGRSVADELAVLAELAPSVYAALNTDFRK
jgi:EpsI family protein